MRKLWTICFVLAVAPAFAEDAANIALTLTPAEVVLLEHLLDHQPISKTAPAGFWSLRTKLVEAVTANPDAKRAFDSLWK